MLSTNCKLYWSGNGSYTVNSDIYVRVLFLQNFAYVKFHYHNNRIFDLRAGAGASSTSVGPFPGNWLAARIADLTPDLQVLLS